MRTISNTGANLIKKWEGLRLQSYLDPVGIWTIGYGHTRTAGPNQTITEAQADQLLRDDIAEFEGYVRHYVNSDINQSQFDALVSFTFNLGPGALQGSTLLRKVNANPNDRSIPDEFRKWNRAGGYIMEGLVRRREEEAELYANGQKKK